MQGSINFDGSLVGNITGGGGGGGDTVVITPVVTSGTKIADVSVNGVEKDLYCPTPPTPPEIDITPVVTSGTKIATIEVDGNEVDLYAPNSTQVNITPVQQSGTKIATIGVNGVNTDLYAPNNGGHEYSTTEHVVGTWIDGRPVYEKTFTFITNSTIYYIPDTTDINHLINVSGFANKENNDFYIPYSDGSDNISIAYTVNNGIRIFSSNYFNGAEYTLTIQYTKSSDAPT